MFKNKFFTFTTIFLLSTLSAHAQAPFAFYGGLFGTGTTDANRGKIFAINSTTGAEATAVDLVTAFPALFGSAALTFQGTNGYSYDPTTDKFYFSVTSGSGTDGRGSLLQGDKGVYWWQRSTNTAGQLLSFTGLTTPDQDTTPVNITRQLGADNSFVYNGYYYFFQDQAVDSTPNMYRINLTGAAALQTLNDFNGANTRDYYDYGDIAVTTAGFMSGSAGDGRPTTRLQWFFSGDISGGGASPSFASYSETTPAAAGASNPNLQLAYGWATGSSNNTTLYGQSGTDTKFYTVNSSTGAIGATALFTGARGYTDLTSAAIPEPTTLTLALLGSGGFVLKRRRKNK
jgi:hypothetical protein